MPDLWDTNPDNVFPRPDDEPDPAPSGQERHTEEVRLKDHSGNLRLPAYVLIALATALATVLLLTAVLLILPP
jgi:hypothetical protein